VTLLRVAAEEVREKSLSIEFSMECNALKVRVLLVYYVLTSSSVACIC